MTSLNGTRLPFPGPCSSFDMKGSWSFEILILGSLLRVQNSTHKNNRHLNISRNILEWLAKTARHYRCPANATVLICKGFEIFKYWFLGHFWESITVGRSTIDQFYLHQNIIKEKLKRHAITCAWPMHWFFMWEVKAFCKFWSYGHIWEYRTHGRSTIDHFYLHQKFISKKLKRHSITFAWLMH